MYQETTHTTEMSMNTKHVGTVEEAAEVLQISRNKAYEAAREGQIPSIRVGRKVLVLWGPLMAMVGAVESEVGAEREVT